MDLIKKSSIGSMVSGDTIFNCTAPKDEYLDFSSNKSTSIDRSTKIHSTTTLINNIISK
jgi:hypothetical protein